MEGILPERWRLLPEIVWVIWLTWELIFATAADGRYKTYRVSVWRMVLTTLPRYFIWWAGGFFAVFHWPQWTMLLLHGWLLHIMVRYDGIRVTQKQNGLSAVAGTLFNVFLLYMGGFWG